MYLLFLLIQHIVYIPEVVDMLLVLVEHSIRFLPDTEWQTPPSVPSFFELQQPSVALYRPKHKTSVYVNIIHVVLSYPFTSVMLGADV
jgi:hypothetical protein